MGTNGLTAQAGRPGGSCTCAAAKGSKNANSQLFTLIGSIVVSRRSVSLARETKKDLGTGEHGNWKSNGF